MRTFAQRDNGDILRHHSAQQPVPVQPSKDAAGRGPGESSVQRPPLQRLPAIPSTGSATDLPDPGVSPIDTRWNASDQLFAHASYASPPMSGGPFHSSRHPMQAQLPIQQGSAAGEASDAVHLQNILFRLGESERLQRMMMVEMAKLHAELNEAHRIHDSMVREMHQSLRQLQDRVESLSKQMTTDAQGMRQQLQGLEAQHEATQKRLVDEVHERVEKRLEVVLATVGGVVDGIKQEVDALGKRVADDTGSIKQNLASQSAGLTELSRFGHQHQLAIQRLEGQTAQLSGQVDGVIKASETSVQQFGKAVQEYCVAYARQADEDQRTQVVADLGGRIDESLRRVFEHGDQQQRQDETRFASLFQAIEEQKQRIDAVTTERLGDVAKDIDGLRAQLAKEIQRVESARTQETGAMVQVVTALKTSVAKMRDGERQMLEALDGRLAETRQVLAKDIAALRQEMSIELRRNSRPLIVM
ncbi:hypothetical protein BC831DRAFT_450896 [Entophlyctis helioformis]|nr:hypothetical protein BC831DRAFT_450896 [Entophlyctis helioformis]